MRSLYGLQFLELPGLRHGFVAASPSIQTLYTIDMPVLQIGNRSLSHVLGGCIERHRMC